MSTAPAQRDWFGQPRGLTILFLTQMWEIFSYYGMRALLVYYMTKQLLMGQQQASLVYGLYAATVYFTPILGGVVSDRWLGRRRAVIIGGAIMAIGHFLMASESLFYLALASIALGNGLFLPSLPSQVDGLYQRRDPRRGSAYNIYYVGINVGGLLAPLVCGTLGELYGWHYGFGAAGIGMLLGLAVYVGGGRYLPAEASRREVVAATDEANDTGLALRLRVLLAIALCVMLFRGAYEQIGNTIALWADTGIDRSLGALTIPMTWFQALNPMLVILLTPVLVAHWSRQAGRGREPGSARKMALGAGGVALAYLLLAAVSAGTAAGQASWVWLALFFLVLTMGELFILPVGLGLFARLAPSKHRATTVAAWFFAAFGGNLLAGLLGMAWSRLGPAAFFALMAAVAAGAGVLLGLLDRSARRMEAEARPGEAAMDTATVRI
ncbi:peptide MFS transporter [Luteimonas suaedae]|uniref:peptide MFS transporter n=1 Tax=Luteimonas suaedae TaxID=2605430 RepID=UPI0011EC5723|nr:peptide MFS transporter [Luteimonas suaedae]